MYEEAVKNQWILSSPSANSVCNEKFNEFYVCLILYEKNKFNISRLTTIQKREKKITGLSEGHLLLEAYKLKIK